MVTLAPHATASFAPRAILFIGLEGDSCPLQRTYRDR